MVSAGYIGCFIKQISYYKKESVNMVSLILFSGKTGFELAF